jgi:hypothetical protein
VNNVTIRRECKGTKQGKNTKRNRSGERKRKRKEVKTESVRRERNDNMIAQKGGRWPRRSDPKKRGPNASTASVLPEPR